MARRTFVALGLAALIGLGGAVWWVVTPARRSVLLVRGQAPPESQRAHCDDVIGPPRIVAISERVRLAIGWDLASTILVRTGAGNVIVDVGMSPARAAPVREALLRDSPGPIAAGELDVAGDVLGFRRFTGRFRRGL
ncbi:hypothetical protein [Nannocystis pusilla]|uniref:Uncharacterized protein n=1 Tax=Nannocystis pusilla TaxID=889268 RepID=A0ABS7TZG6_9BACT|nr:hypothetical protein [Nannocystis pusilla]MBZ5713585.1 hypothetical protein [Nannocystis pusilla]